MSFLTDIGYLESAEQEAARLARSPKGSKSHEMSRRPVRVKGWIKDLVIELPWDHEDIENYRVLVVPYEYSSSSQPPEERPRYRHDGWWYCIVVASDHPSYPVGGHRLCIPEFELVRGSQHHV